MSKDKKILSRIKNLLDMASDSSSPNEAMIAAKRARTMMDKYQIGKEDLLFNDNDSFGTSDGKFKPPRKPVWVSAIAASVAHLNDSQAVVKIAYKEVTFQFRGFTSDAIIAKYTHDYLIETCDRLLNRADIKGVSNKNYYRLGFAKEISRRIALIVSERKVDLHFSDGKSLVILKRELVDAHFDNLKNARKPNIRKPNPDEILATMKGVNDAKNVSLDRQIENEENLSLSI